MPGKYVNTGSPTSLTMAHAGVANDGALFALVAVTPLSAGYSYTYFTRTATYNGVDMVSLGAVDSTDQTGWLELFYLTSPGSNANIVFTVDHPVGCIVMESASYGSGFHGITPGSFTSEASTGTSTSLTVASAPNKMVIGGFACSAPILGQQVISFGGATSGFGVVGFGGQFLQVSATASAASLQAGLQGLPTVGAGGVSVTGSNGGPWTVTFTNLLANSAQPLFFLDPSNLSGGGPAGVTSPDGVPLVLLNIQNTDAGNVLLIDSQGAPSTTLTATTAGATWANWCALACSMDSLATANADHQALTTGVYQGLTGAATTTPPTAAAVQSAATTVSTNAQSATTALSDANNILATGSAGATDFGNALASALGDWVNAVSGSPTASASSATYAAAQQEVAAAAAALQSQINGIQAQIGPVGGPYNFYGGPNSSGNVTLSQTFTSQTSLPAGFAAVTAMNALVAVKNTTPLATNTQTVTGVWSNSDNKARYLFLRANTGFTTYVYAKIQAAASGNSEIGCVVGGVKTVFSSFVLPGSGFAANATYRLSATASAFTLTGPNGLNQTYTDSGPVSQMGAAYVYGGFGHDGTSYGATTVDATGNYTFPAWIATGCPVDVVTIGGSGGGQVGTPSGFAGTESGSSTTQYDGFGGGKGGFSGAALIYGTDITAGTTTLACTIGTGGTGGVYGGTLTGGNGTATSVIVPGHATITGAAGVGGGLGGASTDAFGQAAGAFTLDGITYTGGLAQGTGAVGNIPGGGGGSGWTQYYGSYILGAYNAGAGAHGRGWITPYSLQLPGTLSSWSLYDSGPTSAAQTGYAATSETTTSTTFTTLTTTTDQVTVNIGPGGSALVSLSGLTSNGTAGQQALMSFAVSGANTISASTNHDNGYFTGTNTPTGGDWEQCGTTQLMPGLTAGATTFQAQYKVTAGTGTFQYRRISVMPL